MTRWRLAAMCLLGLMAPGWLWAEGEVVGADCAITWKASPTPTVTQHRLYVSQQRGVYDWANPQTVTIPMPITQSSCAALRLPHDGQYYLVATAGTDQANSVDSNEVPFVRMTAVAPPGAIVPPPPTDLQVASVDLKALTLTLAWKAPQRPDGSLIEDITRYVVDAGVSAGVYSRTVYDGPDRSVVVGNLQKNQVYYLIARAVKADGTMSPPSMELVVRPFPDLADLVPPIVRITEIKQGAQSVSAGGQVTPGASVVVRIEAQDAGAIVDVEVQVNGTRVCLAREAPYMCVWTVPPGAKQSYQLQAWARDQAGNIGQSGLMSLVSR